MAKAVSQESQFADRLNQEFRERQALNPRYSLRAFAAFLGTDHSTLSQVFRGTRRAPPAQILQWSRKLRIGRAEASVYLATEKLQHPSIAGHDKTLRYWSEEAISLMTDRSHLEILRLCGLSEFRADSRWIAERLGVAIDQVNQAVSRLLRLGLLEMKSATEWKDVCGAASLNEKEFLNLALMKL